MILVYPNPLYSSVKLHFTLTYKLFHSQISMTPQIKACDEPHPFIDKNTVENKLTVRVREPAYSAYSKFSLFQALNTT